MTKKLAFRRKIYYLCNVERREKGMRATFGTEADEREILTTIINPKTKLNYD